jgi:hypothetical protein
MSAHDCDMIHDYRSDEKKKLPIEIENEYSFDNIPIQVNRHR